MAVHDPKRCIKLLLFIIALTGTGAGYEGIAETSSRQLPQNPFGTSPAVQTSADGSSIRNEETYHEIMRHLVCQESRPSAAPQYFPPEIEDTYLYKAFSQFYTNQHCRLAWLDWQGPLPQVDSLWDALGQAPKEGLTAHYYRAELMAQMQLVFERPPALEQINSTWLRTLVALDLRLTAAYLRYASHLLSGQVNPDRFDVAWYATPRKRDLAAVLGKPCGMIASCPRCKTSDRSPAIRGA
jgi:murein L,D-transpeptidase YcbB/YkuD